MPVQFSYSNNGNTWNFVVNDTHPTSSAKNCYNCGQSGHLKRSCPSRALIAPPPTSHPSTVPAAQKNCYRCLQTGHLARSCRASAPICYHCRGSGHIQWQCPYLIKGTKRKREIDEEEDEDEDVLGHIGQYKVTKRR